MATSQMAAMLDELMGRNRNYDANDPTAKELKWCDNTVCRYYLVKFCPHDLFTNTKADLGPCEKIHDDELKAKFHDEATPSKRALYVDDFLRFCQRMLQDLKSRITRAKERLLLTQERDERVLAGLASASDGVSVGATGGADPAMDEKIILLSEKISALVQEAETAGCAGNVEQAQGLLKLSDQLRDERELLLRSASALTSGGGPPTLKDEYAAQQKAMEVCDVCGAFLIVGDAQQRIDDHLLGKQHVGYARLRASFEKITEERKKAREDRDKEVEESRRARREKESEERKERDAKRKEPSAASGSNSTRLGEKGRRSRSRSRDGKRRSRSRSRDRRRNRDRSRSRERRRSRSRERSRRDRSRDKGRRDRSRDRSRDRRRSRSRSRSRRDRSRDRQRSRSRDRRRSRSRDKKD